MAVTTHWKFVHVFCNVVVDETDDQTPVIACTPVTVGEFDDDDWVTSFKRLLQPTLTRAATSNEASNVRVISAPREVSSHGHRSSRASSYNLRMAILKVARMGHPVLRAKAKPIPPKEIGSAPVQQLIDDMFETMREY